jgi:HNH endonuclease
MRRNQHSNSGSGTTAKTTKGYLRITAGPCRHEYVHRIVAAAMLGRGLKPDEQVHHRNGDKTDPRFSNLFILGTYDHGWVSAKQAYFVEHVLEVREKRDWDEFMDEQARKQQDRIHIAKAHGDPVEIVDNSLALAWAVRAAGGGVSYDGSGIC